MRVPPVAWLRSIYRALHPDPTDYWHAKKDSTAAGTALTLMAGQTGRHLHIQTLVVNNRQTGALHVDFYDGSSTASNEFLSVTIPANNTAAIIPFLGAGYPLGDGNALIYRAEDAGAIEISAFGAWGVHEDTA